MLRKEKRILKNTTDKRLYSGDLQRKINLPKQNFPFDLESICKDAGKNLLHTIAHYHFPNIGFVSNNSYARFEIICAFGDSFSRRAYSAISERITAKSNSTAARSSSSPFFRPDLTQKMFPRKTRAISPSHDHPYLVLFQTFLQHDVFLTGLIMKGPC